MSQQRKSPWSPAARAGPNSRLGIPGISTIFGAVWDFNLAPTPRTLRFQRHFPPFFQMTSPRTQNLLSKKHSSEHTQRSRQNVLVPHYNVYHYFCIRCAFPLQIHLPGNFPGFSGIYHEIELGIWHSPSCDSFAVKQAVWNLGEPAQAQNFWRGSRVKPAFWWLAQLSRLGSIAGPSPIHSTHHTSKPPAAQCKLPRFSTSQLRSRNFGAAGSSRL